MDINNVLLEGTRQYFMGLPKQAQGEGSGQPLWPANAPLPEEGTPAQSGAPAPSSRPPSAAAAPPSVPTSSAIVLPRPPSEPIEPEPHIIHKATVMREAAEKRREQPDIEDDEEAVGTLSPPSHIIHKPPRTLPSPAPAAPCPSPVRPPSGAPLPSQAVPEPPLEAPVQYRPAVHRVQTPTSRQPDHYAPGRPPDPYPTSRPPESYVRYHYDPNLSEGNRNPLGPVASPQPSNQSRHSPAAQTYARLSGSMQHSTSRLREVAAQSPPTQRYSVQTTHPPPPPNDRVPPIHHPQTVPQSQRHPPDSRATHMYTTLQPRREASAYHNRTASQYDRHHAVPPRKYDPQQSYPSYRPSPTAQPVQSHRVDTHHPVQYKHTAMDVMSAHYTPRSQERAPAPIPPHPHDANRLPPRSDYPNMSRSVDARSSYHYPTPSTSTSRFTPVPIQNSTQSRSAYRTLATSKNNFDYSPTTHHQLSPVRSTIKPGYPNQNRITKSVTSIVNEMNQTKQKHDLTGGSSQVNQTNKKRESPLDLSVKTVKNSADSSTTQDEVVDSATTENKMMTLPPRAVPYSSRHVHLPTNSSVTSHKVDFAPNFVQYGERGSHGHVAASQSGNLSVRYGTYEGRRTLPEGFPVDSPNAYQERSKYTTPARTDYIHKIDLTRPASDQRHPVRDDRHFIIEERKRPAVPLVSNIPEKIIRPDTWPPETRLNSAREQRELMKQPVYSYKQFEAVYQSDHKRPSMSGVYRDQNAHTSHRYPNPYHPELVTRESADYHNYYQDRNPPPTSRNHVIQKIPSHIHSHLYDPSRSIPADKKLCVRSILRSSLETKQIGFVEPTRSIKQSRSPDLIIIDDAEDSVIEINDLTKDSENEILVKNVVKSHLNVTPNLNQHIQMPKAVDSFSRDSDFNNSPDPKRRSPENDVASRIRTKAELKVMPPSQESITKPEPKLITPPEKEKIKMLPRKTHLFNQIREDNLRLESVIKNETQPEPVIPEVKTEPMNIEEIEKDADISINTEHSLENIEPENMDSTNDDIFDDLDWVSACDSFMEQLKNGCHKKKTYRKRVDTTENDNMSKTVSKSHSTDSIPVNAEINSEQNNESNTETNTSVSAENSGSKSELNTPYTTQLIEETVSEIIPAVVIKQEPLDDVEINTTEEWSSPLGESVLDNTEGIVLATEINNIDEIQSDDRKEKANERPTKTKFRAKVKIEKNETSSQLSKKDLKGKSGIKTVIKEECESTDDDEPLIKSKILKEKEQNERLKYRLLKDLSEKSAYVKLECCNVDVNKNTRKSLDSTLKDKEEKQPKAKLTRQASRAKVKSSLDSKNEKQGGNTSSDSDDDVTVASRLRIRKSIKAEENKSAPVVKTPVKSSPVKKQDSSSASNSSTPIRKPTFGDGSYFHPGWEEELYKYKRSLRMPTRLIAIPRGRSGGPFVRGSGALFTRGSTSLPDLDPAPLSPAPSSAQSAATDDLYARRPDKLTLDSDLDSNSSYSGPKKLNYDSEASTSTVFSSKIKKKANSILDVLLQKYGPKEERKKEKKVKEKEERTPKIIAKKSTSALLPTPGLGLVKNGNKGTFNIKKEKLMEDILYSGGFRKETVAAFRSSFIKDTDGLIGATEEFATVVLKTRTRTESRILKQRATIKEVFGDERPASAPPTSCREEEVPEDKEEKFVEIKKESTDITKLKLKPKKILKNKLKRRSSSIRDGLRSTKSLKRNDAKGRLLRLKKRNSLVKSLNSKRMKELSANKNKNENSTTEETDKQKLEGSSLGTTEGNTKRRLKRLFGRRKFSSGFDYIRKKKKIIRRDENSPKIRRPAAKPSPESVHDIQKEIKGWFINKSIGETHLHRAARLGYTVSIILRLSRIILL